MYSRHDVVRFLGSAPVPLPSLGEAQRRIERWNARRPPAAPPYGGLGGRGARHRSRRRAPCLLGAHPGGRRRGGGSRLAPASRLVGATATPPRRPAARSSGPRRRAAPRWSPSSSASNTASHRRLPPARAGAARRTNRVLRHGARAVRQPGVSLIRSRRKPLPLFSTLTTSMPPICAGRRDVRAAVGLGVEADDVDDAHHLELGRQQVRRGPDEVGVRRERLVARQRARPRSPGRRRPPRRRPAATRSLKPSGTSGRLKSIRASSGSMLPPVTSAPKSRNTTPDSRCRPEWVRISGGTAGVLDRAAHRRTDRRERVALGRHQLEIVALADADDAGLHAAPEQHAVVGRLPAAAGVEGRPVEHDALGRRRRGPSRPTRAGSGRPARAGWCGRADRPLSMPWKLSVGRVP